MKMMIWKPRPAQIAVTMIENSAWSVERMKGCCGMPSMPNTSLMMPIGGGW